MRYESYIVLSPHFNHFPQQEIDTNVIGQKAQGLLNIPKDATPPFIIITSELHKKWLSDRSTAEKTLKNTLYNCSSFFKDKGMEQFIVRSSAKYESFNERGFYKSSKGKILREELFNTIIETWQHNISSFKKFDDNGFAIIIQEFISQKLAGHLSNERRISRNKTKWLYEIVNAKYEFLESKKISVNSINENTTEWSLYCDNKKNLIKYLKSIAKHWTSKNQRCHIEWVWSGKQLWIVQNDIDIDENKGKTPGCEWKIKTQITGIKKLECFSLVSNTDNDWDKIKCIKTFIKCQLPYGNIYILEDPKIIQQLANEEENETLRNELKWLLEYPIVIRTDKLKSNIDNNFLLPRTDAIFTIEVAYDFLKNNAKKFINQGLKETEFCFLIHRFIISKVGALAFSKPTIPNKARIDSTWGIVEGLYYHPHDSFEVSLTERDKIIKKHIRCKTEYIDVNNSGNWISKRSGTQWDWAESLNKKQILDITEFNTKIAKYLNSAVTVMYFVDVDTETGYPSVLPWFYTTEEITESSEKFTDIIFSEKREIITNENDLLELKKKTESEAKPKITIRLKLKSDILRNKVLIETIGDFAISKNIPIELEGSILSHPYYILRTKGVKVKCIDTFEPKYKKQKFYKLVRDKIPVNIESKGEKVITIKIDSAQMLKYLKEKAIEESYEFYWETEEEKIIEELADMYEIIRSACKVFGIKMEELNKIAQKKNAKKGSFEAGVFLLETTDTALIDIFHEKEESLFNEEAKQIQQKNYSKTKNKKSNKITFNIDKSIVIPYISATNIWEDAPLETIVIPNEKNLIEISYTPKGIKFKIIQEKSIQNPNQLSFNFNIDPKKNQ